MMFFMDYVTSAISSLFMLLLLFGLPLALTVLNFYNLFSSKGRYKKRAFWATVIIGGFLYGMLAGLSFNMIGKWNEAIYENQYHEIVSSQYELAVLIPGFAGFAGLVMLYHTNPEKTPPLVSALSMAAVIILNIFQTAFAVQISRGIFEEDDLTFMLYVYHLNIYVLSATALRDRIRWRAEQLKDTENADPEAEEKTHFSAGKLLKRLSGYSGLVFVSFFFLIAVMEIIFVLTGLGADAPVKVFTDTADWTFSQQIPPPPLEYEGHYLCTVAAGGHRKIVKPLRYGKRRGAVIVVNRQLCIANAFEDYIQEKLPLFHKMVRGTYDRLGFPVSRYIDTPLKADIIYIIMKPLEWIFLIFLYLFDVSPEKRINRMYEYK